ncbi:uncharacterized protein LOC107041380 [Diachasma alloeum]|uniref:uncharacterized protein LOC107041380 n=1 Tax=Diachasma alloeum TaxID=454923 RepID=UPI0007384B60|nr:uncharacterized protein LOC107041380 [Diachasma alloeum]
MRNSSVCLKRQALAKNHSFVEIITVKMIIIAILLATMSTGFVEGAEVHRNTRAPLSHRSPYQGLDAPHQVNQRASSQHESSTPQDYNQLDVNLAYKPFDSAPAHIRRLIYDAYGPQQPYVNPHAFFYKNYVGLPDDFLTSGDHRRRADEEHAHSVVSSTAAPISYRTAYPLHSETVANIPTKVLQKGGIKYKEDIHQKQQFYSPQRTYGLRNPLQSHRNSEQTKRSPVSASSEAQQDQMYDMPVALQTLLSYQAQIPYNVLANHIIFETKKPFVPKPLPEDAKYSSQYPNKIFYIRADGQVLEGVPAMGIGAGEIKYKDASSQGH